MSIARKSCRLALLGIAAVAISACATAPSDEIDVGGIADPLEPVNRVTFGLNQLVDGAVVRPAAEIYGGVVPELARDGVTNFLRNLRSPIIIANQALQGDWQGVDHAAARMLINTTVGLGGVFDLADYNGAGIPYENEDFGQTLAVWGVEPGFYVVLPLLGPSSLRDTGGLVVDTLADPVRIALHDAEADELTVARTVATVLDARSRTLDATDELEASSVDYYAATRSLYVQLRQAAIADGEAATSFEFPEMDEAWLDDGQGSEPASAEQLADAPVDRAADAAGPARDDAPLLRLDLSADATHAPSPLPELILDLGR